MHEGFVVLKESGCIRIEMFYDRIKMITSNMFVWIFSDPLRQQYLTYRWKKEQIHNGEFADAIVLTFV